MKDSAMTYDVVSILSKVSKLASNGWFPGILILLVGVARSYYSLRTGFLLPDEAFYILGTRGEHTLRTVFLRLLGTYFTLTGSRDVFAMLVTGPLFGVMWSIGAIVLLRRVAMYFSRMRSHAAYCALTLAVTPVFAMLAPTFLTEPPSLFFAILGTWQLVAYLENRKSGSLFLSAFSFSLSAMIREPYLLFLVGNALLLLILSASKRITYRCSIPFAALAVAVATVTLFPRAMPSTSSTVTTSVVIYSPTRLMSPPGPYLVPIAMERFFVSVLLGWSPIIALMVVAGYLMISHDTLRSADTRSIALTTNITLALGALGVLASLMSRSVTVYPSFLMRLSHTGLPSLAVLPRFFSRVGKKGISLSATVFLLYLLVFGSGLLSQAQSGLSSAATNRLDLNYVSPYFRLFLFLKDTNEPVLLFAEPTLRASLFLEGKSNVVIRGLVNQTEFARSIRGGTWSMVLLYGELYPDHFLTLHEFAPFYEQLVRNQTSYRVSTLWWDAESYLLSVSFRECLT
jgi:hypothetical protein